jgi:hypothetical protein
MKKVLLIMIVSMGVLSSCVQERNKYVVGHRVDGNDTTTLQVVRVDKNFQVGEVVFPVNGKFKYKIVRGCRDNY